MTNYKIEKHIEFDANTQPENYHLITYVLDANDGKTILTLKQENIQSQQAQEHSDKSWDYVLAQMKELAEKTN